MSSHSDDLTPPTRPEWIYRAGPWLFMFCAFANTVYGAATGASTLPASLTFVVLSAVATVNLRLRTVELLIAHDVLDRARRRF